MFLKWMLLFASAFSNNQIKSIIILTHKWRLLFARIIKYIDLVDLFILILLAYNNNYCLK